MDEILVRTLTDPRELARIPRLEQDIWGNDDPVPASWIRVMLSLRGEVSVAYTAEAPNQWLGFTMSIGGFDAEGPFLYSHQAGVIPERQGQGIGRLLKYHQNRWAEQAGYTRIRWTFDPLRALNAHFNIAVLGVRVMAYYPDYYGPMGSALNRGLPSDRLLCEWRVPCPTVPANPPHSFKVYIPRDIGTLEIDDPVQALRWREVVRRQFEDALRAGLRVTGFTIDPFPAYLFAR